MPGRNPPMVYQQAKPKHRTRSADRVLCRCLPLIAILHLLAGCGAQQASTPDCVATGAAIEKRVRSSLTEGIPTPVVCQATSMTFGPDVIASSVALQRAVAATLTAEQVDLPTPTVMSLIVPTPDAIATGVAVQRAIASTLTADARSGTPIPEISTPVPSATPSATPAPTQPPPTQTPTMPDCSRWDQAEAHIGTHHCICGVVTGIYDDPGSTAFFINFSSEHSGYYAVSFNLTFHDLAGKCIRICGMVDTYRDRPQTVISQSEQLQEVDTCP